MKNSIFKSIIVIGIIFIFSGCSEKIRTAKSIKVDNAPKYAMAQEAKIAPKNKGSLFSTNGQSLFSDRKNLQMGDIILVKIEEGLSNSSKDSRKTNKTNSTGISGGLSLGTNNDTPSILNHAVNTANGILGLTASGSSANSFTGSSQSTNTEVFTTTISAVVEKKYQNGNYFIIGSKIMLINGQQQKISVSGMIRPYDIESSDNSIASGNIANLKVVYNKIGFEADAVEKPWGSKAIERIAPY